MKIHKILFAQTLLLLSCSFLIAQTPGKIALTKGDSLYGQGNYDEAMFQYELAKEYYLDINQMDSVLEAVIQIAYVYIAQGDNQGMIDQVETAILTVKPTVEEVYFKLGKCYALLGYAKRNLLQYSAALESYEHALKIFEKIKANNSFVAYTYRNAAQIYVRRLDYAKTIDYLKRGLTSDSTNTYAGTIYGHLAKTEHLLQNFDQALKFFKQGISLPFEYPDEKATILTIGADIYAATGELDKASELYHQALPGFDGLENIWVWAPKMEIYLSLAKIAEKKGHSTQAEHYFQKALKESNIYPIKKRETAALYVDWGIFHLEKGALDQALNYFQKALTQVIPNFNSTNLADNPPVSSFYPEPWIITISVLKGQTLKKRYEKKGELKDLRIAGESYLLALAAIDLLKATYGTEKAKLYIGDFSNLYFEQAIEVFYQLNQKTGEIAHLDQVFQLMERSKAALLKEARQQHQARLLATIPDSIILQEEALRSDIAEIKKLLAFEKLLEKESSREAIDELEAKLLPLEEQYKDFLIKLKGEHPQYKELVENAPLPKLEEVQQGLGQDGRAILEYFWGDESAFVLWISHDQAGLSQLDNFSQLSSDLNQLLALLGQNAKLLESPDQFNNLSHRLYKSLGIENLSSGSISNLLIIPDGLLHYLPFELLLTEAAPNTGAFGNTHLLQDCTTRYAYTAIENKAGITKVSGKRFLKVAPGFSNMERGLLPLKFSDLETSNLKPSLYLQTSAALASTFLMQSSGFDLIHLSTHAEANPEDALPRIEFIDTALFLPEIYAMKTQADLVVLSACETGMGKIAKGEGAMSLARGFLFAGASSLVSSLWKVNERSTATIISHFYGHLKDGKTKSEALREAKLQYLREAENDIQKSPYYWAGLTLTGQDGTIALPNQSIMLSKLIWLALSLLLLVWLGWIGKKVWRNNRGYSKVVRRGIRQTTN